MIQRVTMEKEFAQVVGYLKKTRKADMLYCEFEDQNEQKFWKRLGRKGSEQKAGVGYTVLVGGTNNYIDYVGKECVYAINYTKDAFILNESCYYQY